MKKDPTSAPSVSDLLLDRYLAGELDDEERAELERTLAQCASSRERLDELRASRAAFSAVAPRFEAVASRARRPLSWRLPLLAAPALAAAAALLLLVGRPAPPPDEVRTKGKQHLLEVWVERDGRVFPGAAGERLSPGDRLRFRVSAPGKGYAAVLSYDGRGAVSLYAPRGPAMAAGEGQHLFDNSVRLDDSLGEELLLGIWCGEAAPLSVLKGAVAADGGAGEPRLPEGCRYEGVRVLKEHRRP